MYDCASKIALYHRIMPNRALTYIIRMGLGLGSGVWAGHITLYFRQNASHSPATYRRHGQGQHWRVLFFSMASRIYRFSLSAMMVAPGQVSVGDFVPEQSQRIVNELVYLWFNDIFL